MDEGERMNRLIYLLALHGIYQNAEDAAKITEDVNKLSEEKVALPKTGTSVDHGTAGQFAVSDGNGGIVWKTLVEAEAVSY